MKDLPACMAPADERGVSSRHCAHPTSHSPVDAAPDPMFTPAEARLEAVVQPRLDRLFDTGLTSLAATERTAVLSYIYINELNNGGLMQFFHNSSSDLAHDTVLALQHLGADRHAAALSAAAACFPTHTFADGPDARMEAMEGWAETKLLHFADAVDQCEGDVPALEQRLLAFVTEGPGSSLA